MKTIEKKQNFDLTNITDDYNKMQQISGLIASTSIFISIFVIMTSDIPRQNLLNIWYTIGLVGIFTFIYYLFPRFYGNKKLQFLPDLVFVLAITITMLNLQESGQFFYIFLLLILAINAFSMSTFLYSLSFIEIISALLLVNFSLGNIAFGLTNQEVLFELYGVIAFGIVLRIFATETAFLRKKQDELCKRTALLSEQKKEIYHLINNISEGMIAVDRDKKITFLNRSALRIIGVLGSVKGFVGKNLDDILLLASSEGNISVVDEVLKGNKNIIRDDLRLVNYAKTIRLHTNTTSVTDERGKVVGAIVLFRDISAKMQLEEQKAEFNAIASHELRTPLTIIEGFLYCILSDKTLKYDKKTKEYIEKSYDSACSLLQLSNDILTVIKTDENKLALALEEVNITNLIDEVLGNLKPKAKEKHLKLTAKTPRASKLVITDRQKVKEVITNLVENALKFTDKGSVVVELTGKKDKEIIISVKDTGCGIPREDQKMIFQKFYRSEDWQTRKTRGTGLGLYISHIFVHRLGGEIGFTSKKNVGSTFWFSIPLKLKNTKN